MKRVAYFLTLLFFGSACSASYKSPSLHGFVFVSPTVQSKLSPSDILFIFVFPPDSTPFIETAESSPKMDRFNPVPLLVKKIAPVVFPVKFQVSEKDIIFPDKKLPEKVNIYVRIDKDGDPKTLLPGDLEGNYKKNPTSTYRSGIEIVIDKEVKPAVN